MLLTVITFVTWIGSRMTAVALPLVALAETGEAWTTGLVGGFAGLPLLTVAWWGRGLRDRLTSGRALAVVTAVNAVGLAVVPVAALAGRVDAVALCLSGLVTGSAGALLGPAQRALVADFADGYAAGGGRSGPARWLAWQDLAHRVSMIFAPPLGAWLVVAVGTGPLLWCETAAIAVAAVVMLAVPAAARRSGPVPGRAERVPVRTVLRSRPQVAAGVVMGGIGGVCWFGFTLGLAVLGVEHDRPGALIAAGMSGYGTASVIASLLVPLVIDRLPRMAMQVACWIGLGVAFVLLPVVAPNPLGVAAVAALGGAMAPWGIAALNALISEQTTGAARRTAFTVETVLHSGGASLGLLVGGALIGWAGPGPVMVATGVLQVLAAIGGAAWAWRVRAAREAGLAMAA
ncbi:hypothetical protein Afil01_27670 [Actinorhabdospora filicis]|uniref:MFS transporter n=2 Tax=Actinorhabdospora filicis TaxID=1785913 RepID=A0A9W6WAS8_9ACTN|nr:hypothetical protein Afil01_27670 [Actinorhabdospora filicis]